LRIDEAISPLRLCSLPLSSAVRHTILPFRIAKLALSESAKYDASRFNQKRLTPTSE
jgi:hypothetical protein